MIRKYFGTDGIRGRVGDYPITPDFVLKLGWAAGRVLLRQNDHHSSKRVVIGKDTRISGYMFESALEAGLSAAGISSCLLGPMPTPAVAYLTRTFHAQAGIVISASHNPFYDNGIKFFSGQGFKLPDEIESEIEKELELPLTTVQSEKIGRAMRITDAAGRYIEFCKSTVSSNLSLRGLKIVVDCAFGATYHVAPKVFQELDAEVIEIGVDPDGLNINDGCGATNTKRLQKIVVAEGADVGIALDGDGDRLIMVDHKGETVDGDEILFIISKHLKKQNKMNGGVVGTLMSNFGLEMALKELGIDFVRAKVGDRYVMEALLKNKWRLGGEASGHIIYLDATTTGDGIISALQVLTVMIAEGISLHDIKRGVEKMPQILINVKVASKDKLKNHPDIESAIKETEKRLKGRGRVLLRPSGTEPLVRVMIEGEDQTTVEHLAKELAAVVERAAAI